MKDSFFATLTAIGAGVASTLLGGWDKSLEILLIFIIMDYVTGVGAAFRTKTLKSSVGFEGLMKKGTHLPDRHSCGAARSDYRQRFGRVPHCHGVFLHRE